MLELQETDAEGFGSQSTMRNPQSLLKRRDSIHTVSGQGKGSYLPIRPFCAKKTNFQMEMSQCLKFFCAVAVVLSSYGCRSPGVGIAEEPLHQLEKGQPSFLLKRKTAQKLTIQSALSDAFQKLAIVVLESGKVAVEYILSEESIDARSDEEPQSLIQISSFPWNQPGQREECLPDFSLEEEEPEL
ncbi:hypothetical protein STEG23_012118 [Scotinomys teguina]